MGADETRAILQAYRRVMEASWPDIHPSMAGRAASWGSAAPAELQSELARYLHESSESGRVRVFWKLGPELVFGGGNALFARDAGVADPAALVGRDDFDERLPWTRQAAKYRDDDEQVFYSGRPRLDIVERQTHADETLWVRVGKAPIVSAEGDVIGVLGMYEVLDKDVGRRLYAERMQGEPPHGG
jgi:hypothetical protein